MSKELLFGGFSFDSGRIYELIHHGITNQDELIKACPEEFKKENKWSLYVGKLIECCGKIENWKWRTDHKYDRGKMIFIFGILLKNTGGLPEADCRAIAGWMLSEMLTEVPEYIPLDRVEDDEAEDFNGPHGERW